MSALSRARNTTQTATVFNNSKLFAENKKTGCSKILMALLKRFYTIFFNIRLHLFHHKALSGDIKG